LPSMWDATKTNAWRAQLNLLERCREDVGADRIELPTVSLAKEAPVIVLGLDPGTERSALVELDDGTVKLAEIFENEKMLSLLRELGPQNRMVISRLVIEEFESFGMIVGREVFEAVFWSGRFAEAWGGQFEPLSRRKVKLHLCGDSRAKDPNVRQALIDRYGGKESIRKGGPLYGVHKDCWSALALCTVWEDLHCGVPEVA